MVYRSDFRGGAGTLIDRVSKHACKLGVFSSQMGGGGVIRLLGGEP